MRPLQKAFVYCVILGAASCATPVRGGDWPSQRAELARRVEVDQDLRRDFPRAQLLPGFLERLEACDRDNTAWLKPRVEELGWPKRSEVGPEAANQVWLLVQHADHDVDFQERCLALLRATVESGEAEAKDLAYLEDRVAMHRGRPQRYGTQFVSKGERYVVYDLLDPARVDEWRAEVGLGSMAEYEALVNAAD